MKYIELEKMISEPRLSRYLNACGESKGRAQKLYKANLHIAQAFYPVLNIFEVILRNAINDRLKNHLNRNWIINETRGFMNDPSLAPKYYLREQINASKRKIRSRRTRVNTNNIVAEQTLGFWISMFEDYHHRLLGGVLLSCFPHKPRRVNRNTLHQKMKRVNKLRNRVYHNEPICFDNNSIDFSKVEQARTDVLELLSWIGVSAEKYCLEYDNILNKIESAKKI